MQIVIDINEDDYKEVKEDTYSGTPFENKIFTAIANGIPISDNATNGDVIRTLFEPNLVRIMDDFVSEEYEIDEVWWNSLYQKGGNE